MKNENDYSILFIDGKAIAHSTDYEELIRNAYELVGDIEDDYSQTHSINEFKTWLDWHSGVNWLQARRIADGSEVWIEILDCTWYINELTDELIPIACQYCMDNGIEIQS